MVSPFVEFHQGLRSQTQSQSERPSRVKPIRLVTRKARVVAILSFGCGCSTISSYRCHNLF
jgi:hypothetical protein